MFTDQENELLSGNCMYVSVEAKNSILWSKWMDEIIKQTRLFHALQFIRGPDKGSEDPRSRSLFSRIWSGYVSFLGELFGSRALHNATKIVLCTRHRQYHNFQPQYQYQYPKTHLSNTNTNTNTSDLANLNTNTNTNTWKNLNTQYSIPIPQYQYLTLQVSWFYDILLSSCYTLDYKITQTSSHTLCKEKVPHL